MSILESSKDRQTSRVIYPYNDKPLEHQQARVHASRNRQFRLNADKRTYGRTKRPSYRDVWTHLKRMEQQQQVQQQQKQQQQKQPPR